MEKTKNQYASVRKRLTAAIAMLLIAAIMLVTSTYAWFTLSTAPEVTGITTTVGANGNLEIALAQTKDGTGITSAVGDSYAKTNNWTTTNVTWGNLIDLSENYGLENIVLQPARLNATNDKINTAAPLLTAVYGNDGRVEDLAANTMFGILDGSGFKTLDADATDRGVRPIGFSSEKTEQQLAHRTSLATMNAKIANARANTVQSLNANGSDLASIVVKHATADGEDTNTYSLAAVDNAITALEAANADVEAALKAALVAAAAKNMENNTEAEWTAAKAAIEDGDLADLVDGTAPESVQNAYAKYTAINTALTNAKTAREAISGDTADWTGVSSVLTPLMDPAAMTVNGKTPAQIKEDIGGFASSAIKDGITVVVPSGSGVYADFADLCGNYSADVVLNDISYNGINLDGLDATMETASAVNPALLTAVVNALSANTPAASEGNANASLTDTYGYALDFFFRTNASQSNLVLQTEAANRIYKDGNNADVMGGGSTMSFKSTATGFTTDNISALMDAIRIVFASDDGTILSYAMLENKTVDSGTVTADVVLADRAVDEDTGAVTYTKKADSVITPLVSNTPQLVSVYVYLDGDVVDNSMVANASQSMTGSMNLQFASDATLVPSEYTPLK